MLFKIKILEESDEREANLSCRAPHFSPFAFQSLLEPFKNMKS